MSTLGIDLGTGSVKVAVVDDDGRIIARHSRPYAVRSTRSGWAESDPRDWLAQTVASIAQASGHAPDAVGLSGQMHGVVLSDADGQVLRPAILWADSRATVQARSMHAAIGATTLARLGSDAVAGFAATSLAWVREHEPEIWARTRSVRQPKDWLRGQLGGIAALTDASDATGTLLADIATGTWSTAALDWVGIDAELLPRIDDSTALAGTVAVNGRELPVVVGGADTACVIAGLGLRPGDGFIAVGTGAQVVEVLPEPLVDETLRTHTFATVGAPGTGWYRLGAVQNAGLALSVVLGWLGAPVAEANAALDGECGDDDPLFVPTLSGERTPFMNPDLRGSWHGLSMSTDRVAMLRSALEAEAQAVALAVDAVNASGSRLPDVVPLVGGGAHHPAFRQLLADATGCALGVVEAPDAAVVGAALLAAGQVRNTEPMRIVDVVVPRAAEHERLSERRRRLMQYIETDRVVNADENRTRI